jgi:hypothetical protein
MCKFFVIQIQILLGAHGVQPLQSADNGCIAATAAG